MLSSIKEYASSVQNSASETITSYTSKDKVDLLLIEITSNDQWTVSNQKLLEVADLTTGMNRDKIIDHLLLKLKSPTFEWKRINKTLSVIEFIIKYGDANCAGKIQMKGHQDLQSTTSFSFAENGIDKGGQIRNKS